jgi:hypothetical protein
MTGKSIVTLSLAAVMALTAAMPNRANAAVLVPTAPVGIFMAILGVAFVSGSIGYVNEQVVTLEGPTAKQINNELGKWIPKMNSLSGTIFVNTCMIGLVLDDSGHSKIQLAPVSDETANMAKLTSSEVQAYNSELEITQQIIDQIADEIAPLPEQERLSASQNLWQQYRSVMSNDSFNAFQKIMIAQLQ